MPRKRQDRLGQDRGGGDEGALHDQRRDGVGQDVAEHQDPGRRADRDGALDIGLLAHREHDRAHQAHDARHVGHDDGEDHGDQAGAPDRDQRDGEQYARDRHQPVHDAHDDAVEPADVARHQADHEADRDGDRRRRRRRRSATRACRRARGCRRRGPGCRCPSATTRLTVLPSSSRKVISVPGFLLRDAGSMRVGSTVPRNGARMAIASMISRMTPPKMTLGLRMASAHRLRALGRGRRDRGGVDDFFGGYRAQ